MNEIFILTGSVRTGKTTRLIEWCKRFENVNGIVTPVIQGKRVFLDLHSKEIFSMEANEDEKEIHKVGKYIFSKNTFNRAEKIIESGIENSEYLVIDEIGPLELEGKGFSSILKRVLDLPKTKTKLILVIRDTILKETLDYFKIENYHLLEI